MRAKSPRFREWASEGKHGKRNLEGWAKRLLQGLVMSHFRLRLDRERNIQADITKPGRANFYTELPTSCGCLRHRHAMASSGRAGNGRMATAAACTNSGTFGHLGRVSEAQRRKGGNKERSGAEATATTAAATNKQTRNGPFAGLVAFHGADITVIAEPDTAPTTPNFVSIPAVVVVDGGVTDECRCCPRLLGWNGLGVGRTHVVSKAFVNMNHSLLSLAECRLSTALA